MSRPITAYSTNYTAARTSKFENMLTSKMIVQDDLSSLSFMRASINGLLMPPLQFTTGS